MFVFRVVVVFTHRFLLTFALVCRCCRIEIYNSSLLKALTFFALFSFWNTKYRSLINPLFPLYFVTRFNLTWLYHYKCLTNVLKIAIYCQILEVGKCFLYVLIAVSPYFLYRLWNAAESMYRFSPVIMFKIISLLKITFSIGPFKEILHKTFLNTID